MHRVELLSVVPQLKPHDVAALMSRFALEWLIPSECGVICELKCARMGCACMHTHVLLESWDQCARVSVHRPSYAMHVMCGTGEQPLCVVQPWLCSSRASMKNSNGQQRKVVVWHGH